MLTGLYPSRGAFKDTLSAPQTSLSEKIEPRCRNVETEAYITRLSCRNRACHFLTPAPLRLLPVVHPVLPPTSGGLGAQSESLHVMTLGDLRRSRGLGEGNPAIPASLSHRSMDQRTSPKNHLCHIDGRKASIQISDSTPLLSPRVLAFSYELGFE